MYNLFFIIYYTFYNYPLQLLFLAVVNIYMFYDIGENPKVKLVKIMSKIRINQ